MLSQIIQRSWYRSISAVTIVLLPLSALFCAIAALRRASYKIGIFSQTKLPVPVIVVGNISVGGTGKTPLVIAITQYLKSKGYRPGVVSRGYGGQSRQWPRAVTPDSSPTDVGDEAVLVASRCGCPVSVGPDRVKAAETLLASNQCNIIVSDDGLQHLALQRHIEIVVIDGERRFGNGLCLPAGPMREPASRLNQANIVVSNGQANDFEYEMRLAGSEFQQVNDSGGPVSLAEFSGKTVHAVAGIGNNERFFKVLEDMSITIERHAFADHYAYSTKDVEFGDDLPVVMTEKDAVKCKHYNVKNAWYLKVNAILDESFYAKLDNLLERMNHTVEKENG